VADSTLKGSAFYFPLNLVVLSFIYTTASRQPKKGFWSS